MMAGDDFDLDWWIEDERPHPWAEWLDDDDLADPVEAERRFNLVADRLVAESEELFVRGVLRPDAGPLSEEEWAEWRAMVDDGLPVLVEGGGRLERFLWRVKNGRPVRQWDLEFIAAGVERHLAKPDANPWPVNRGAGGRPKSVSGPSDAQWRQAAEVQFYRRLLPEFDRRAAPSQSAFAKQFGYKDDKSIRKLEKLEAPAFSAGNRPPAFTKRVDELIQTEGLDGVTYDPWARKLVRPDEQNWGSLMNRVSRE